MSSNTVGKPPTPSPEKDPLEWLKLNYSKHKISYLANRIGKRITETVDLLFELGVDIKLTPEQERHIRHYYVEYSVKELATEFCGTGNYSNLMETKIIGFIQRNGIKKNYIPAPVEHRKRIVRVRGEHSNELQEDRISRWLQMSDEEIKNHKGRIKY